MGSAEPERSLSSGISLPQWMKGRIADRYDLQEAFSPPSHDDNFFYIRYPKASGASNTDTKNNDYRPIKDVLEMDHSKHTAPCREVIHSNKPLVDPKDSAPAAVNLPRITKSQGTDDGFKNAECGKSVVDVAHQMIAGTFMSRPGTMSEGISAEEDAPATSDGFNFNRRRGSKSLPASPLHTPESSPRTCRKYNRYFTGAFVTSGDKSTASGDGRYSGWILSGFLGQQREAVAKEEQNAELRRNQSSSALLHSISEAVHDDERPDSPVPDSPDSPPVSRAFEAKPSELREMNFWSPTSM